MEYLTVMAGPGWGSGDWRGRESLLLLLLLWRAGARLRSIGLRRGEQVVELLGWEEREEGEREAGGGNRPAAGREMSARSRVKNWGRGRNTGAAHSGFGGRGSAPHTQITG